MSANAENVLNGTATHIYDPDSEEIANAGLKPVAVCVECDRFSLSEIIICKGSNNPKHKGWRYQVVCIKAVDKTKLTNTTVLVQYTVQSRVAKEGEGKRESRPRGGLNTGRLVSEM